MSEKDMPTNTREKTSLLFDVMGWKVMYDRPVYDGKGNKISTTQFTWTHYGGERWVDLYHHKNMGLSWKAIEWVADPETDIYLMPDDPAGLPDDKGYPISTFFRAWWQEQEMWTYTQEEAHHAYLDKILDLSIRAGKVEAEEKEDG